MRQTKLGFIYSNMKGYLPFYEESPDVISLRRENGQKLSASIVGPAFCLAAEWNLYNCVLRVNREDVAKGRIEIMLWMLENAPRTYNEVVRLSLKYEKEESRSLDLGA